MPRHLPWIKHWTGAIHDPVLLEMSLEERGAWFSLELLAGELNSAGRLSTGGKRLTLKQMGRCLHLDGPGQAVLESMVAKMTAAGLLGLDLETLYFTNWERDQAVPHWLTPEGQAERQRESRAKRFGVPPPPPPLEGDKEGEEEGEGHVTVTVTRGDEARGHWKKVMARLQRHMTKANFATWLKGSRGLGYDPDGLLVVEVAGRFAVDNLNRSLYSLARRALMEITGGPADIEFVCPGQAQVKEAGGGVGEQNRKGKRRGAALIEDEVPAR